MAKKKATDTHRDRIMKAALTLLTKQGRDAVTTRSVADAAKVQPPVLYRLFGNKTGLLDAVAAYGFEAYLAQKSPLVPHGDALEALKTGWTLHIEFGLANPELYLLMYAKPRAEANSPAAQQGFAILVQHMQNVAAAGQLRVSLERACAMYHAAAIGVVMSLLATPRGQRDLSLSRAVRDHVLSGITTGALTALKPVIGITANRLRALLIQAPDDTSVLTVAERLLFLEWLKRLTTECD